MQLKFGVMGKVNKMKITKRHLRQIIKESLKLVLESRPRPNPRFKARPGEPQVGQVWSMKKMPKRPGSFTYHGTVEVLGYRGGPLGKEIIVKSLTHPNIRTAIDAMPLVSFLGGFKRES